MKVLVLGGSGMLGHAAYRTFAAAPGIKAFATLRGEAARRHFPAGLQNGFVTGVDVLDTDALAAAIARVRPDVVVNAVGLVKQLGNAKDPLAALPINALFPHRLARLCALAGARVIHVSTDCVFLGDRGNYTEADRPDADDLYGRSKLLGEVDEPHAVTLRTSIIGRELGSRHGLVDWFLGETGSVRGFTRAVFSGLTTDELSRVMLRHVLPNPGLRGVWHVSVAPVTKHDLLVLLRDAYGRDTRIEADDRLVLDRSLDSTRFRQATGWVPLEWPDMIATMRDQEWFA
ncbi:dTDP-4-dehydrorhamnose reductase family protein [Roseomonas sp. CCTCC AB2023176]|uniref:dTDP-4-dehydrorhamnose reductase family protein n=1 Tax=Roseomonas sp. CCTCC AB2023176 TaxID=3342640 RepID=UPI0035DC49FE